MVVDSSQLVWWRIRCVDRKTNTFFDRDLVLDWDQVPADERETLREIIDSGKRDHQIINFRQYFHPRDFDSLQHEVEKGCSMAGMSVPEYFEDEDGTPLDIIGLTQIVTGEADPILLGEPQSVLRLGPATMIREGEWTSDKANDICHFLQLVQEIGRCGWLRNPLSLTTQGEAVEVVHPNAEMTTVALTYIRQMLLRRDDALNRACEAYLQHVGDDRKRDWVKERQDTFNLDLKTPQKYGPEGLLGGLTMEEIIDIFTYGPGMFHRESNHNLEERLAQLIASHGRERVVFAFNAACRNLLQYVFHVAPVIWQDYSHWINTLGFTGPDRVRISDLFG